ncbi:MAG: MBL fold metallo-hydrolase, partial [Bacteroidaceae bacterium]|nr:MBL fold metallo-hydrolase [Bacteroidaceae bacterium]
FMRRTLGATAPESLAAIADGDILRIGNVEMQVIHTPGHTPGGVCYYVPSAQLVFTGDTLFNNGVGRTDFEGGSAQTLFTSIRERLFTLPSETKVLPGHGPSTTIDDEM